MFGLEEEQADLEKKSQEDLREDSSEGSSDGSGNELEEELAPEANLEILKKELDEKYAKQTGAVSPSFVSMSPTIKFTPAFMVYQGEESPPTSKQKSVELLRSCNHKENPKVVSARPPRPPLEPKNNQIIMKRTKSPETEQNNKILRIWSRLLKKNATIQLLKLLDDFELRDKKMLEFLCNSGKWLLAEAVLNEESVLPLVFICVHVPDKQFTKGSFGSSRTRSFINELIAHLQRVNYEVLIKLLNRHTKLSTFDDKPTQTNAAFKLLAQKLNVLLELDPEGVPEVLTRHCGEESIWKEFLEKALPQKIKKSLL